MDNVTHGLAGLLLADATIAATASRTGRDVPEKYRKAALILGFVAAEFPDVDVFYSSSLPALKSLGFMLHHRGYTHTVVWALLFAIMLFGITRWWVKRGLSDQDASWFAKRGWKPLLTLALVASLSHLVLDYTNSYGLHPFWPLDDSWYFGDAVFIVEPWLWIVAIPAIFWERRHRSVRAILLLLALAIVALGWSMQELAPAVAIVLIVFLFLWLLVQKRLDQRGRAVGGIAAWLLVTLVFFAGARSARAALMSAVQSAGADSAAVLALGSPQLENRDHLVDAALAPTVSDPSCWSAVVITSDGVYYRVSNAVIAPWPRLRNVFSCRTSYVRALERHNTVSQLPGVSRISPYATTAAVWWRDIWAVPRSEMRALAEERCEVVAALRFMRTPVWTEEADGTINISDARFGVGTGFAHVAIPGQPATCSLTRAWVPPWVPARLDMIYAD